MTRLFRRFDIIIFYNRIFILLFFILVLTSRIVKIQIYRSVQTDIFQKALSSFFYSLKNKSFNKTSNILLLTVLRFILLINFLSVFPFRFPLGSQFGVIFGVRLTLWVRFIILRLVKSFKGTISHFIPEGTPLPLTLFLFVIEVISSLIRPLTLTVRLVANILAGHLLLILLSKLVFLVKFIFLSYLLLNIVELAVALIQAYIFSTIITLYFSEVH